MHCRRACHGKQRQQPRRTVQAARRLHPGMSGMEVHSLAMSALMFVAGYWYAAHADCVGSAMQASTLYILLPVPSVVLGATGGLAPELGGLPLLGLAVRLAAGLVMASNVGLTMGLTTVLGIGVALGLGRGLAAGLVIEVPSVLEAPPVGGLADGLTAGL